MVWRHRCVEEVTDSNIKISERSISANFPNPGRFAFQKVQVDGCLVRRDEDVPRADWIVTKLKVGSLIVELKGSDAAHGCDQVFATAQHPSCTPWIAPRWAMLVVCGAIPSRTTIIDAKKQEARRRGWRLEVVREARALRVEDYLHGDA
jgi:hypothetical protein